MNIQKKRFLVYSLLISFGFLMAFLFLRKDNSNTNGITVDPIAKKDSIITVSLTSEFFNLENNNEASVSTEKALSGKHSCKLSNSAEFGVSANKFIRDIPSYSNLKNISVKFNTLFGKDNPDALYVLSIADAKGKNVFWEGKPIVYAETNNWSESIIDFIIPAEFLNPDNLIVIYPWNRNKKMFYVDDVTIDFIGTAIYREANTNQATNSNLFFDFETEAGLSGADNVKETKAHSGKKACDLSGGKEYGTSITKKFSEIGAAFPKKISLSMWVYPLTDKPNTVLVASVINSKKETVFWEGKSTENKSFPKNTWTKINASYTLPIEKFSPDDVLEISVWNKGKTDVLIDDIEIVYGEPAERRGKESTVDPISIYEKRFKTEKNKPPFKTIYFEKQEIKNGNTASITPSNKKDFSDYFSPNNQFIVGDFYSDKNNLDEVLCIGSAFKGLYSYSVEEKQFKKLWGTPLVADSIWNDNNTFYSGDFNADGKIDILLVDKHNNNWGIINFNGKEWLTVSQGNNPKKEWLTKNKTRLDGLAEGIYPGNYLDNKQTFLKLNTDWRFDLKLVENVGGENMILGNVEFNGYPNDFDPKYYEFIKIVPGNFLSKSQTSLLVVMCNCADEAFDGKWCDKIDDLPFLPNSVQLYRIQKESGSQIPQINADKK